MTFEQKKKLIEDSGGEIRNGIAWFEEFATSVDQAADWIHNGLVIEPITYLRSRYPHSR